MFSFIIVIDGYNKLKMEDSDCFMLFMSLSKVAIAVYN